MPEPLGSSTDGAVALALTSITKRFGATLALEDVSLTVRRGTVHALLGENGAGKTTLMRIAFGMIAPDAGQITVDGTMAQRFVSPADAIAAGDGGNGASTLYARPGNDSGGECRTGRTGERTSLK